LYKQTVANGDNQRLKTLDIVDYKIIALLVTGDDNKEISSKLHIPLSTIQRRTREILMNGIVRIRFEPNFRRLGIKKGLLHVYLTNGDIKEIVTKVSKMDGILSSSVHVGNSDVVGEFVYEDSEQLVDTISHLKHLDGVSRVLWSEEVYSVPVNADNVLSSFKKMWSNGNNRNNKYSSNARNNNKNHNNDI